MSNTNWAARIDALLRLPFDSGAGAPTNTAQELVWTQARLALAAERMREPHEWDCDVYVILNDSDGQPEHGECTCGLVADVLKILEGK